jgi:hypothetical protein
MNQKLVESLVQIILSLSDEERRLLKVTFRKLRCHHRLQIWKVD